MLLHSRENHQQNKEITCEMGEYFCNMTNKELTYKIYQQLIQVNIKTTTLIQKWSEDPNRSVPPKKQRANRHMKRCSTPLIIRKLQIKKRDHLTPVKMAIIKKSIDKCWWVYGGKGILILCWWECKSGVPTMENSIEVFFKKTRNRTTIWSNSSNPGYLSGRKKWKQNLKKYTYPSGPSSMLIQ